MKLLQVILDKNPAIKTVVNKVKLAVAICLVNTELTC